LAIAISAIVLGAVTQVVIVFLKTSDQTTARLIESRDTQTTSEYFANDVAAIGTRKDSTPDTATHVRQLNKSVDTDDNDAPFAAGCTTSDTPVLLMAWDDPTLGPDGAVTVVKVRYATVMNAAVPVGELQTYSLRRQVCVGGTGKSIVIAHDIVLQGPKLVEVKCDGSSTCTGPAGYVPSSITMTFYSQDILSRLTPVKLTLTGQRRQT
jgi:hypothetical protein